MVLRCTARLLGLLGTGHRPLVEVPPADGDWYANLVWLDRRKCVLAVHAGTLFPVFVADVRKHDLDPPGRFLVPLIEAALAEETFPAGVLGPLDAGSLRLARTASRRVLGFMNEMTFVCRSGLESAGSLEELDLRDLNRFLRRELHNLDGVYRRPIDLVAERLAGWGDDAAEATWRLARPAVDLDFERLLDEAQRRSVPD